MKSTLKCVVIDSAISVSIGLNAFRNKAIVKTGISEYVFITLIDVENILRIRRTEDS